MAILTLILNLILKFWNGMKPPAIVTESEKAGQLQQALETEQQTNVKLVEGAKDRVDYKPLTADELRQHTPENDPNFRD